MTTTPTSQTPETTILKPEDIRWLVVHCSDTPDDQNLTAADIHSMHLSFGWDGIGYHRLIRRDGVIEQGRPDYWTGAHVRGHNTQSLGVCLIGRNHFTTLQMQALASLLTDWQNRLPDAKICGHGEFAYTDKTCPNFNVAAWCQQQGLDHGNPPGLDATDQTKIRKQNRLRVITPSLQLTAKPEPGAALDTEALFGEDVLLEEQRADGFAHITLCTDGYQGWVSRQGLGILPEPTHRLITPRSVVTAAPDVKSTCLGTLPLGALLRVEETEGRFARIITTIAGKTGMGFVAESHLLPLDQKVNDWVAIAETLLHTPYRWGGRDSIGLDCSALVQLGLAAAGISTPRDSGPQEKHIGHDLDGIESLQRGDLVFWRGHVGIMQDARRLLHANAHHGMVASEPLREALPRLTEAAGPITRLARPPCPIRGG